MVKFNLRGTWDNLKANWNAPREGEYLSIKEFVYFCTGGMGIYTLTDVTALLSFVGTSVVVGMVLGIGIRDAYIITTIGTIVKFVSMPLTALITDNLGVLPKKTARGIHIGSAALLGLSAVLWFVPSSGFDAVLKDLYKHIALKLVCQILSIYLLMYVLKYFAKKYGKFKPQMLLFGLPALIFATALVYLPYNEMRYASKLLWVHLITNLITMFSDPYGGNVEKMQGLLSSNPQERMRIFSIAPIPLGLMRSLFGMFFPLLATLSGGQLSILSYRWIIPAFGALGMLQGFLVLKARERVIQAEDFKPKIDLRRALREVFANKYIWIRNISHLFQVFAGLSQGVLGWLLLYGARFEWLTGILLNLSYITMTPGNLLAPFITKRFSKRQAILGLKGIVLLSQCGFLAIIFLRGDVMKIAAYMGVSLIMSLFNSTQGVINQSLVPDIWDYQQWRSGERMEASTDLFGFVSQPLTILLGFLMPWLLKLIGLVNDWDILYDAAIRNEVIMLHIIVSIAGVALTLLPFIFWDLTPEKHRKIILELEERARGAEKEERLTEATEQ